MASLTSSLGNTGPEHPVPYQCKRIEVQRRGMGCGNEPGAVRNLHGERHHRGPDQRDHARASTSASTRSSTIAKNAEEVGLDVFALGEHHNPPFFSSSPTTTLAYIAAQTERLLLSTVDDAHHHERPGEDRRGLRDAAAPRRRSRRPHARPRQHRPGLPVVRQGHPPGHRRSRSRTTRCCTGCGARTSSTGRASSARRCRASPRRRGRSMACRRSSGTARSAAPRSPSRPRTTATASSRTTSSGPRSTTCSSSATTASASSTTATAPPSRRSSGSAARCSCAKNSQDAVTRVPPVLRQRAGVRPRPVARGLHRADPAHRRQPAAGHRPLRRRCASTSATTSASCSSWITPACR